MSVENRAINFVIKYEKKQKRKVENVSHSRHVAHRGFDLISKKGSDVRQIEVKGTTKENGIPDPYWTEFNLKKRLVATHLYVVYLPDRGRTRLYIIRRNDIQAKDIELKRGWRISYKFKKYKLPRFIVK